jgi:hypothetical protein
VAQIDWKALKGELRDYVVDGFKDTMQSAEADLQAYGTAIANGLIIALRTGDLELAKELKAQVQVLAEIHRVKVTKKVAGMLDKFIDVGMRIGLAAMTV